MELYPIYKVYICLYYEISSLHVMCENTFNWQGRGLDSSPTRRPLLCSVAQFSYWTNETRQPLKISGFDILGISKCPFARVNLKCQGLCLIHILSRPFSKSPLSGGRVNGWVGGWMDGQKDEKNGMELGDCVLCLSLCHSFFICGELQDSP